MKPLSIFLSLLIFSFSASAEILFRNPPSEEWKTQVLAVVEKVEAQLPQNWPQRETVQVYYSMAVTPTYFPILAYKQGEERVIEGMTIVLGDDVNGVATLYSEFLFDGFMRENLPAWNYSLLLSRQGIYPKEIEQVAAVMQLGAGSSVESTEFNLAEVIEQRAKSLGSLEKMYAEQKDNAAFDSTQLESSISDHKEKVADLTEAQEIQTQYQFPLHSVTLHQHLAPFEQLFTNALVQLALGDESGWDEIKTSLMPTRFLIKAHLQENPDKPGFMWAVAKGIQVVLEQWLQTATTPIDYEQTQEFNKGLLIEIMREEKKDR